MAKLGVVFFITFASLQLAPINGNTDFDFEDYDDEYEYNANYTDETMTSFNGCVDYHKGHHECSHDKFPDKTLQEVFGSEEVRVCCGRDVHAYTFHDNCELRKDSHSYNKEVCAEPTASEPDLFLPPDMPSCPHHCEVQTVSHRHVRVDKYSGEMSFPQIRGSQSTFRYCAAFHCKDHDYGQNHTWQVKVTACVCYDDEVVAEALKDVPAHVERCCPESLMVKEDYQELRCPVLEDRSREDTHPERRKCVNGEWKALEFWDMFKYNLQNPNNINVFNHFSNNFITGNLRGSSFKSYRLEVCTYDFHFRSSIVRGFYLRIQPKASVQCFSAGVDQEFDVLRQILQRGNPVLFDVLPS